MPAAHAAFYAIGVDTDVTPDADALAAENAALRAQLEELERARSELMARTTSVAAAAEERTYWLERWQLDLNALMSRPWTSRARAVLRALRRPARGARTLLRRARRA